jgi:uncharacterized protein (DUF1499 family)
MSTAQANELLACFSLLCICLKHNPPLFVACCLLVADRNAGWDPVQMPTTLPAATSALLDWIRQQPRTTLLAVHRPSSTASALEAVQETVIHARFVSLLWGFADDVFVRLSCNAKTGAVLVEAQGQLRVGVGDMEVNVKRNAALMVAMKAAVEGGQLPAGPCGPAAV